MSAPRRSIQQNVRTASFWQMFEALPQEVRELADEKFRQFEADPNHHSLRRHALRDTSRGSHASGSVSVSINRQYRAVYFVDGETNVWYWVGTHADYDTAFGS